MSHRVHVHGLHYQGLPLLKAYATAVKVREREEIFYSLSIMYSALRKPDLKYLPYWDGCLLLLDISLLLLQKWVSCRSVLPLQGMGQSLQYRQYMCLPMTL